ncbi:MAG: peptide-methionine (S)-S-oxide reductase MsrA [Bacteroidota bacterium]|nr:peptide-methionine (S)-S-oxide reductase MsrA [Bacteroidota bacterium]
METATLGTGCFWCSEAIFNSLKGVIKAEPGYSGGTTDNPTYEEVCTGTTGHAEVVRITFDPQIISYKQLLEVFWLIHDPTTLNRQGADHGTQYRSVIFYQSEEQRKISEESKKEIEMSKVWSNPIVTQIVPFRKFYPAESYHHDYFIRNPKQPYCQIVINPKLQKFREHFKALLKN